VSGISARDGSREGRVWKGKSYNQIDGTEPHRGESTMFLGEGRGKDRERGM
jgi:hypothetical protein